MDLDDELTDDEDFLELVQHVRHPRAEHVFRERSNHYEKWNDEEFKARFRLSENVVRRIEDEIGDNITSVTMRSHALTASEMIFRMLRFLATGCFLQTTGDFNGVDKSTACRVIYKVARAIAPLSTRVINMPRSKEEITDVRQGFYNISRFPRCLGALDCAHVKIISPGKDNAEIFRNRKALGIRCKIENVEAIVVACAVLHNVACHMRDENPPVDDEIEAAVNIVFPENAVEDRQRAEGNDDVRNTLINEYFQNLLNVN
ncbi:hypothetical protein MML48_9g00001204 [Holotrichia oblita]|uniref:Uncharacterized protein n=1 Tax=Holotrichia oblita TaxID=644536 RepID=A0ACB9SJW8_HOLOL|nr:hypothetical protein MML48_9g00001204 [Holotrichia oblita]